MQIALAANEAYLPHAAVAIRSLLDTQTSNLTIHLLHSRPYSETALQKLERLMRNTSAKWQRHEVGLEHLQGLPGLGSGENESVDMWLRCLLPELLPEQDRVLYLDCDTVVCEPLDNLYALEMGDHELAAVSSPFSEKLRHIPQTLGLPHAQAYFNSGILLLNLEKLRKSGHMQDVMAYGRQYPERMRWQDQDALNVILWKNRLALHPRYNVMTSLGRREDACHAHPESERQSAMRVPAIVHYEGGAKPWQAGCPHPFRNLYFLYLARTPWGSIRDYLHAPARPEKLRAGDRPPVLSAYQPDSILVSDNPGISVVIPTHNRADMLERAIRSALAQTLRPLEILVVDDASTDNTHEVVERLSRLPEGNILHYLRNEKGGSAARTRNRGVKEARGDYIGFLDDDDEWLPEKLEKQYAQLRRDGPALNLDGFYQIVHGQREYVAGTDEFARIDYSRGFHYYYRLIATTGWLVNRQILLDVGMFDESFPIWEDWELGLRISQRYPVTHRPEALHLYHRDRPFGLTEIRSAWLPTLERLIAKHGAMWVNDNKVASHYFLLKAQMSPPEKSLYKLLCLVRSLLLDPRNAYAWGWLRKMISLRVFRV